MDDLDDSWADSPALSRQPVSKRHVAVSRAPETVHGENMEDDSWADGLLQRRGRAEAVSSTDENVKSSRTRRGRRDIPAVDPEDDIWVEGGIVEPFRRARRDPKQLRWHYPGMPAPPMLDDAVAAFDDCWAESTSSGSRDGLVNAKRKLDMLDLEAQPQKRVAAQEDANLKTVATTSVNPVNLAPVSCHPAEAISRSQSTSGPDIPDEYCTFNGRLEEMHIHDPGAEERFKEVISHERLASAFPSELFSGLPLLVGLDFEWKPDRRPTDDNPIALVQVACWDAVVVLRTVGCRELPTWVSDVLEDHKTVKLTASFDVADKAKLRNSFGWDFDTKANPQSFIDIAELAKERELPHGMAKMAKALGWPMRKLKAVGSSNWACDRGLSSSQREYAADDAFFQLYLFGKLIDKHPSSSSHITQAYAAWKATEPSLTRMVERVDNAVFKKQFLELRSRVCEAVQVLSKALGSKGVTNLNDISAFDSVRTFLSRQKAGLGVNIGFLKQNQDLFCWFKEDSTINVRLRHDDDPPDAGLEEESDEDFLADVVERLVAYKPPLEKKQSVIHRLVPEPLWVPARALMGKHQCERMESFAGKVNNIKMGGSDDDGLLLCLTRHPRAAEEKVHMRRCVLQLQQGIGSDEEEALSRLQGDDKFMQFFGVLQLQEAGSKEEASVERSLKARVRILTDAHLLTDRIQPRPGDGWREVQKALEKVKSYRQLLGSCLSESADTSCEAKLKDLLDAVVEAWPDMTALNAKATADAKAEKDSRKSGREQRKAGKGKGKGKKR
mmetsp:Transcript_2492/g.6251  ORF Transcript_2492/g.6251 Transcript_2492/m.6251 type:complete len:783 (-) Transcript_2492:28-2376(-)